MPNVLELFAGIGGFRVGLEQLANADLGGAFYRVIWSNQWEPNSALQHVWRTYERVYGPGSCVNEDIEQVVQHPETIPDAQMIVGGFPCQDYSVARSLQQAEGIEGQKGALWWSIIRLIQEKEAAENAPTVIFLENVDRLIHSPAKRRGRDFAIILQSLSDLGYSVEWRVINAADYGMPQRRRRTFILAYRNGSPLCHGIDNPTEWIYTTGIMAEAFPIEPSNDTIEGQAIKQNPEWDLADISDHFNEETPQKRVFENAGTMVNGVFYTVKVRPRYDGPRITLGDIVAETPREEITEEFYLDINSIDSWRREKQGKRIERVSRATGFKYLYSEGPMIFPDALDKPSRTIITAEGGQSVSRFKHVIEDPVNHRYRRLVPSELEQLDMFPRGHTEGETAVRRAFFIGNSLVCGIVERIGVALAHRDWGEL
jgi:DNA (cytosine-5)-methyltransferase 1